MTTRDPAVAGLLPGATAVSRLLPVVLVAAVAWPAMGWVAGRRAAARRLAIRRDAAPAVLDLLGAALLAGLNPHKAVLRVAERAPDVLHQDLGMAAAVLRLGGTPAAALRAAADRSGLDELRAAAAALEAAERWGAPPAEALAARAEALRSRARLHAEAEAGRAAVRLAFPLVLCVLPAFVLTNVELWLWFSKCTTDFGQVVHGVGVVVAQHLLAAGQGPWRARWRRSAVFPGPGGQLRHRQPDRGLQGLRRFLGGEKATLLWDGCHPTAAPRCADG
jgi:hypothetical protein